MANDNTAQGPFGGQSRQPLPHVFVKRARRSDGLVVGKPPSSSPASATAGATIIPLAGDKRRKSRAARALPENHIAEIMLFTGVQIVRNGTQG